MGADEPGLGSAFAALKLTLDGLSDKRGATVSAYQFVNAREGVGRQADRRWLHSERWSSHRARGSGGLCGSQENDTFFC